MQRYIMHVGKLGRGVGWGGVGKVEGEHFKSYHKCDHQRLVSLSVQVTSYSHMCVCMCVHVYVHTCILFTPHPCRMTM